MGKIIKLFKSWFVDMVCFVLRHTTKIHDNRIVFHSRPDFSDNAKALYKYMMANGYDKKYDIYFAVEPNLKYSPELNKRKGNRGA